MLDLNDVGDEGLRMMLCSLLQKYEHVFSECSCRVRSVNRPLHGLMIHVYKNHTR